MLLIVRDVLLLALTSIPSIKTMEDQRILKDTLGILVIYNFHNDRNIKRNNNYLIYILYYYMYL